MTLDPEHYEGLAGFRQALRRFLAASEAISRRAGITQQQYQAILAIRTWPSDSMAMKDLSEQLLLTHHAAVQQVNRLAKAGLVERTPSSTDRRSVILKLSRDGEALVDALAARHLEEILRQEPLLAKSLRQLRRIAADNGPGADRPPQRPEN
ncbi:MAG TPA: MarR family transcriptional regulator [Caulobacteraceae bacterium]|jgi:DNA-binding MarR family transcriptional regulator